MDTKASAELRRVVVGAQRDFWGAVARGRAIRGLTVADCRLVAMAHAIAGTRCKGKAKRFRVAAAHAARLIGEAIELATMAPVEQLVLGGMT